MYQIFPTITSYRTEIHVFVGNLHGSKGCFLRGSCNKNENYSRDGDSVQQDSRLRNAKMNAFWPECFFAVSKALLSFCCKSNGFENFHLLVAESVTESFTATICNEKNEAVVIVLKITMTQTVQFLLSPFQCF